MTTVHNVPSLRVCVIDIGSNSTRYMIADLDRQTRRITVLFQGTQITRLGAKMDSGKILPDLAAKTLDVVEKFFGHAISLAVSDFKIIGTAALREAANGQEFCRLLTEKIGYPLAIIEGQKEAELVELALAESLGLQAESFCAFDIGGGSTELIFHDPGAKSRYYSLPLGAVRLSEKFLKSDPPTPVQIHSTIVHADAILRTSLKGESPIRACRWIGAGGTVTTLAAITAGLKTYDHGKIHGRPLTKPQWERVLETLSSRTTSGRMAIPGLQRGREDIIVAGVLILAAVAKYFNVQEITVSDRGVLYGLLVEYLENYAC